MTLFFLMVVLPLFALAAVLRGHVPGRGFRHTPPTERADCRIPISARSLDSAVGVAGAQLFAARKPWATAEVHGADQRVQLGGVECWFSPPADIAGPIGRIASLAGITTAEARARFEREAASARSSYYLRPAEAFDEAFCTTVTAVPMSGVLVRKGDRLAYVSVLAPLSTQETASIATEPTRAAVGARNCELASRIAGVVLAG